MPQWGLNPDALPAQPYGFIAAMIFALTSLPVNTSLIHKFAVISSARHLWIFNTDLDPVDEGADCPPHTSSTTIIK